MTCLHDDADKAPCPLCERDAEIARLQNKLADAQFDEDSVKHIAAQLTDSHADRDRLAAEIAELQAHLESLQNRYAQATSETERLRAGIEKEAAYCDKLTDAAIGRGDFQHAPEYQYQAARLRALLQ